MLVLVVWREMDTNRERETLLPRLLYRGKAKESKRRFADLYFYYFILFSVPRYILYSTWHFERLHFLFQSMATELIRAAPQTEGRCRRDWPISSRGATGGPSGDGFLRLLQSGDGRAGRSCAFWACLAVSGDFVLAGETEGSVWTKFSVAESGV